MGALCMYKVCIMYSCRWVRSEREYTSGIHCRFNVILKTTETGNFSSNDWDDIAEFKFAIQDWSPCESRGPNKSGKFGACMCSSSSKKH